MHSAHRADVHGILAISEILAMHTPNVHTEVLNWQTIYKGCENGILQVISCGQELCVCGSSAKSAQEFMLTALSRALAYKALLCMYWPYFNSHPAQPNGSFRTCAHLDLDGTPHSDSDSSSPYNSTAFIKTNNPPCMHASIGLADRFGGYVWYIFSLKAWLIKRYFFNNQIIIISNNL
jgi:hypothetical protein